MKMFKKVEILDEKDKRLRIKSVPFDTPVTKEERQLVEDMVKHLTYSQIEEYEKKYDLRPGMGLAFPQVGINKRLIVIVNEYQKGKFEEFIVVNPKIVSHSEEMIAADTGEGCLSVNREVEGHVPRYARVTIEGYDEDGNKVAESAGKTGTIVVKDAKSPTINLKGDSDMQILVGSKYQEPGFTATDNKDGDLTNKVKITGKVDTSKKGTYKR